MTRPLIFIPTFNERENVEIIYSQIQEQNLECDVLFIDDNSPDGTGEVLDKLAHQNPNIKVVHRKGKAGVGSAHYVGISWAYDNGYKLLITMDADGTHPPRYLPDLLEASKSAQVVVGSRHLREDSLKDWDILRILMTRVSYALTSGLLNMHHDATTAYRVYKLDEIPREIFGLVRSKGYAFFFESLYILQVNEFLIEDVAILLPARTLGNSKMVFRDVLLGIRQLLYLFAARHLTPGRLIPPRQPSPARTP